MKILVTGASGFLGAEVCKQLLSKGYTNICAIKRKTSDLSYLQNEKDKITWFEADLLDTPALQNAFNKVEQVYHCAAVISFNPKKKKWMHQVNVEGTKNIVNLCLEHNVNKLVHVSSIAAIGRTKNQSLITETTEWDAQSPYNSEYGKSKYGGEMEVWRGIAEGLKAVIVNPSMIIGPMKWNEDTGKFFEQVNNGLSFYTTGSNGIVDVQDVAKIMIQLMESDISDERFILSSENWKLKKLFDTIAQLIDKPAPSRKLTPFVAGLAWRFEALKSKLTGTEPLLTKETLNFSMLDSAYSNQKIKDALNIQFMPIQQSLERTAKAYLTR